MNGLRAGLDKAALATATTCAFEAARVARRAHAVASELVDIAEQLGTVPAEMLAAVIAARHAEHAAALSEVAATEPRIREPYGQARRHYQAALRHLQSCEVAQRRLKAKIPEYERLRAIVEERDRRWRDEVRAADGHTEAAAHHVEVLGDVPPFVLSVSSHKEAVVKMNPS